VFYPAELAPLNIDPEKIGTSLLQNGKVVMKDINFKVQAFDSGLDFLICTLQNPVQEIRELSLLVFAPITTRLKPKDPILNAGYPVIPSNVIDPYKDTNDPDKEECRVAVSEISHVSFKTILHLCTTFQGSSGSILVNPRTGEFYGIHLVCITTFF